MDGWTKWSAFCFCMNGEGKKDDWVTEWPTVLDPNSRQSTFNNVGDFTYATGVKYMFNKHVKKDRSAC